MALYVVVLSYDAPSENHARLVKACKKDFVKELGGIGELTQIASSTWLVSAHVALLEPFEAAACHLDLMLKEGIYYRLVVLQINKSEQNAVIGNVLDPKTRPLMDSVNRQILQVLKKGWFS
jgi:hypothetical protein